MLPVQKHHFLLSEQQREALPSNGVDECLVGSKPTFAGKHSG